MRRAGGIALGIVLSGVAARAHAGACKSDEVPYLESGCDGPERTRCWPQSVHPTPMAFCMCDGKTQQAALPSQRWRFSGPCQVTVALYYVGKDAPGGHSPNTLYASGTGFAAAVGQYRRCEGRTAPQALAAARCFGEGNAADDVRVLRQD